MKKSIKKIGLITCVIMLTMAFITPVQAEGEEDSEAVIVLNFWMDSDGGFIFIGDEDIIGEIQLDLDKLGNQIIALNKNINNAQESANSAYGLAADAYFKSLNNKGLLDEHGQTLVIQYDKLNDTVKKLWILRDEVVAFEGHYFDFVNETNNTLGTYGDSIQFHDNDIDTLYNKYMSLRSNYNDLVFVFALIGLGGLLALVCGVYVISKRRSLKRALKNSKGSFKNSRRQPSLVDFIPQPKKVKNRASLGYKMMHIHIRRKPKISAVKAKHRTISIRRNPKRSPIKSVKHNIITHKIKRLDKVEKTTVKHKHKPIHVRRNPEKSPIRFIFSLFHKL